MANPANLSIMAALKTRLDAITTVGGYNNNPTVILGAQPVNPDELAAGPVITIYQTSDSLDEGQTICNEMFIAMDITVSGLIRFHGTAVTTKIYLLWQDIMRALLLPDTSLGGLTTDIRRGPMSITYPDPGGEVVGVSQDFVAYYFETYGSP